MSGDTQRNAISEQLAHRLLPFVTIIALIITLIIPLGYISLEYNRTISEANNFARRLAFDIRTMALEAGDLWKYQATKYEQIFNSYVVGKDIKSIRVEDAEGNPVARQQDATAYRVGILEDLMIYGNKENIVLNNRKIGSIQVAISAHALIIKGILSFLVFVVLGAGLAVTVFRFPLKVVRRLEGKLFDYQVALEKMVEDRTIELKNAVDKARQLSDAAQTATKAKSQFLANMSHEIRTPMNGILGMAELLLMTELNEEQRSSVKTINDSGRMLLNLLNDILDQSKIEAGKFALRNVPFNLRDVIERTIKLFGKNAIAKNIDLASRIEDGTPMELQGDPDRLGQILSNLVSNAVKFTEKGGVTILVKPMGEKLGLHIVHFEVIDTGIGIMEEDQKLIFEPFTQADTSSTRKHGGTGLGLTISKQLVNMMGGTLIFSSTPGDGSTFGFTVGFAAACYKRPESSLRETTENKASEKTEEKAPIKTEEKFITAPPQPAKKFENIRILLAEDNPVNQIVEKKMLTLLGCNVKIVSNGQEAITAVSSETFDIVLMDCQMPIMDGFSATKLIRVWELQRKNAAVVSNKEFRRIPIIAATAHSLPEERLRCFDAGMDDFLSKPISMEAMTAALNKWLLMKDA